MSRYQKAVKILDIAFSQYIRRKDGDYPTCCTCGTTQHWSVMQVGHWIRRWHLKTRWDERNVNPQCQKCNTFENGRESEHERYIASVHGETVPDVLRIKSRLSCKMSAVDIEILARHYKEKLRERVNK